VPNEPESGELQEGVRLLYQFINQLPALHRALMILYLDQKTYQEIAEILGITTTNVATKISRIKKTLKHQFAKVT
jgi:RNA polymerase sigma-70 factor (ECF subfamily)